MRPVEVYGLVVHTTGAGACNKALRDGVDILGWCENYYSRTGGTHYIVGYDGTLVQMGDEMHQASGVGMTDQLRSIRHHRWERELSARTLRHWRMRWPLAKDPASLFPGNSANAVYVHVEMPPCVFWNEARGRRETMSPRHCPSSRYTRAQHDTIIALACDIAARHGWPLGWHRTGRLVGHEDLSPLTRSTVSGGWDPGALRDAPRFDWPYVRSGIAGKLTQSRGLHG